MRLMMVLQGKSWRNREQPPPGINSRHATFGSEGTQRTGMFVFLWPKTLACLKAVSSAQTKAGVAGPGPSTTCMEGYGLIRAFIRASCSWQSEGLFAQSFVSLRFLLYPFIPGCRRSFSACFQIFLINSCSENSCSFGVPAGVCELMVFLLCHLGHSLCQYFLNTGMTLT